MTDETRYQDYTKLEPGGSMLEPDVQWNSERMVVELNGYPGEVELTPYQALHLLAWLHDHEAMLMDRRDNYRKLIKVCPVFYGDEAEEPG